MPKTYNEILSELRAFEALRYSSEPEFAEAMAVSSYDALVALLTKLAATEV